MIVALFEEGAEGGLRGMPTRAVATVVTKCHSFCQSDVEPGRTSDRSGDLRDLQGMSQPRPLVICRIDENLSLAG